MEKERDPDDLVVKTSVDVKKIFKILNQNRGLILGTAFSFALVTAIYNQFFLSSYYKSSTMIMPRAGQDGKQNLMGSLLGSGATSVLNELTGGMSDNSDLGKYELLLRTRSVTYGAIKRLGVETVSPKLAPDDPEEAIWSRGYDIIAKKLDIRKEGPALNIVCTDTNPARAAEILHAYLDSLQFYLQETNLTQAKAAELFIRERLKDATDSLTKAELSMIQLQKKTGVIELPAQASLALNTAAQIRAQMIEKDMEIDLNRGILKDESQLKKLEDERSHLQAQLDRLIQGDTSRKSSRKNRDFLKPVDMLPELEAEFTQAKREYLIQTKVVELLRQQLEMAQIDSKRNDPMFQVIDQPNVPYFRAGPDKRLNTIIGFMVGLVLSVLFVFIWNRFNENASASAPFLKLLRKERRRVGLKP